MDQHKETRRFVAKCVERMREQYVPCPHSPERVMKLGVADDGVELVRCADCGAVARVDGGLVDTGVQAWPIGLGSSDYLHGDKLPPLIHYAHDLEGWWMACAGLSDDVFGEELPERPGVFADNIRAVLDSLGHGHTGTVSQKVGEVVRRYEGDKYRIAKALVDAEAKNAEMDRAVCTVEIINCDSEHVWYYGMEGETFDVLKWGSGYVLQEDYSGGESNMWRHIYPEDCKIVGAKNGD